MNDRKDLTRWNRSNLDKFRYVDGNAVEYLEILRQQLVKQFADPETGECEWLNPVQEIPVNEQIKASENLFDRQQRLSLKQSRLLETYHQDRRDWAWEISRTFARACHVLTEHTNAYANEGYLGTATQWDNVRRLVEMLDYHPAPPASASTPLVFIAKENKSGTINKSFQIKYSPPLGGKKVIFETLDDLILDSKLNELRPKGWDKSEDTFQNTDETTTKQLTFSTISEMSVINLQGIGEIWARKLNNLKQSGEVFKIKDFHFYRINSLLNLGIGEVWLRELIAKAAEINNFELESGWEDITDDLLITIASKNIITLQSITEKSTEEIGELQQRIELIGAYLDHEQYRKLRLRDLLKPIANVVTSNYITSWQPKKKPQVEASPLAMIMHNGNNLVEALSITKVEETENELAQKLVNIDLLPSAVQFSWGQWPKGDISLHFAPRGKKHCWLNGDNVIRTAQPHGFSAGTFVSWLDNNQWKFAKVIEADKRNIRLELLQNFPSEGTLLYEALPIESDTIATTVEAIGFADGNKPKVEDFLFAKAPTPIFTMKDLADTNVNLPPLMPPGGLPLGSFLFPTPMLPMGLVKAAVDMMLDLGVMVIPSTGEIVFKSLPELPSVTELMEVLEGKVDWREDLNTPAKQIAAMTEMLTPPGEVPTALFQQIMDNVEQNGPLITVNKNPVVKAVVSSSQPKFVINGVADNVNNGDWILGLFKENDEHTYRAMQIRSISKLTDSIDTVHYSLTFKNLKGNEGELQNIYMDFRGEYIIAGSNINTSKINSPLIELEEVPESLKIGQDIIVNSNNNALAAKISNIEDNTITTTPAATGLIKGQLVIYGNVVLASHGEAKPAKILGSGDASKSNQAFILAVNEISFIPDATKGAGVAAAIEINIAGRVWQQVSSLKDSSPVEHHYAIRMTEEGFVKIIFGDGQYGRRLPSGKNNIKVNYRVGSGLAGNVPIAGLQKPVNPHTLIEAIQQPVPAAGGGDMEDVDSLRSNAPSSLLALERAVSLSDFAHLTSAQSSIWQAKAYSQMLHSGKTENVNVVIVPADGIQSSEVNDAIRSFLQKHALPNVHVSISPCEKERFALSIIIKVKTDEFIAQEVEKAVTAALLEKFTLKNSILGEHLYRSEVYQIVENTLGVERSICTLNNNPSLQLVRANSKNKIIYLHTPSDEQPADLSVIVEEYLS